MVLQMRSQATSIIVTLALAICLICPLVEMFDQWDHSLQTGSDTEYALVILALCVGVAFWFARFVIVISQPGSPTVERCASSARPSFSTLIGSSLIVPVPISPPALALRV